VLTNLDREASPLIRFSTDDKVVYLPHHSCSCGRPFDTFESGTMARYDDMIKIKAMNVWPSAVEAIIFQYNEIEEYSGRVGISDNGEENVIIKVEYKSNTDEAR